MSNEPECVHRILNLGAGVQSTTVYLMYVRGEIQPGMECAIFADTGEEPASEYAHLDAPENIKRNGQTEEDKQQ